MNKKFSLPKLVLFVSGILMLAYVGGAGLSRLIVSRTLILKMHELSSQVESFKGEIITDLQLLDGKPIFPDSPRSKDAQELISSHIGWDGDVEGVPRIETPEYAALLELHAGYSSNRSYIEKIEKLAKDPRTAALNVSWIDQLKSYDHWNTTSAPLIRSELDRALSLGSLERMGVIAGMPLPNYNLYRFAVLVRFLQLQQQGEALKGLQIFRHAHHLSQTRPCVVGAMIAITGLSNEHSLVQLFKIQDWELIDEERIQAFRRVTWAWGGLIHLATWEALPKEFDKFIKPSNGVCAMASEKVLGLGFQDFIEPRVPLESDFSLQLRRSNEILARIFKVCSMSEYVAFLGPSAKSSSSFFQVRALSDSQESTFSGNVGVEKKSIILDPARIPFFRRLYAVTLMTISTPDYLGQYRSRNPEAK